MTEKYKKIEVVFAYCEDWEVMYIDGLLKVQNHSLDPGDILTALAGRAHTWRTVFADEDYYMTEDFPMELKDLKEETTHED